MREIERAPQGSSEKPDSRPKLQDSVTRVVMVEVRALVPPREGQERPSRRTPPSHSSKEGGKKGGMQRF